jgi:hypothetical protein
VRYSDGSLLRARAAADVAADAYVYFSRLFAAVEPDIAVIVAGEADWPGNGPYGLPFFRDDAGEIRPGIVVMRAGGGDFWTGIGQDLRDASPRGYAKLLAAYPDGTGGLDLQPFFGLITIHELGHAFEVPGDLRVPAFWLSEIFVNLAMHAFVATQRRGRCGARRCGRSHRGPGRGHCRGIPGARRLGARRFPLQRRFVHLRQARVHPRSQNRQAPLGRDQGCRTEIAAHTVRRSGQFPS